jgi:hypothetical protein
VGLAYNNTGEKSTPPSFVITGIVDRPRSRLGPDVTTYIEIGTATAGTADQLWIWTDPPHVRYYAGGTAAGDKTAGANWTGFGGTVSAWYSLPIGSASVWMRHQGAGTVATCTMSYDIRTGGIG